MFVQTPANRLVEKLIAYFVAFAGMKCTECGYNCHERCQPQVPWQCKKRDLPEQPGSGMTKSTMSLPSEVSNVLMRGSLIFLFVS